MRKVTTAGAGATMALTASFTLIGAPDGGAQEYFNWGPWGAPGQLPAVSSPNWKLQLGGGAHDETFRDGGTFDLRGSYAAPLSFATGFQVDGVVAPIGGETWAAAAGHYFWRNPDVGLSGLYGSANSFNGVGWGVLGYEAEVYFQRVTVDFLLGFTFGGVDTEILNETRLKYYLTDDFMLSGGYRHETGYDYLLGRAEYQIAPQYSGMTLFADGRWSNGHDAVIAGVRFHFGEGPKSLIRRHREGDPPEDHLNANGQAANDGKPQPKQAKGDAGGGDPKVN